LWLKPSEIERLRRLLPREADEGNGDVWPMVMAEYITAVIEQREGVH
jgi:hypothetical protein